jgi:hypothetical protein
MANHFIRQRVGKYRAGTIDWLLTVKLEERTT